LSAASIAGSSSATNFSGVTGATGCAYPAPVNVADNSTHYFYYLDVTMDVHEDAERARLQDLEPTDLDTRIDPDLNPNTDVVTRDYDYTDFCGWNWGILWGLTSCATLNSADECEKHNVWIDIGDTNYFTGP
jgi:hypothetical protein